MTYPELRQTVLDTTDVRGLAEFWRSLLGLQYRVGDEEPQPGEDWLVLTDAGGGRMLAFQKVPELPAATWPTGPVPQQLHLDLTVTSVEELETQRQRALALGAEQILDRSDDEEEPLYVFRDPAHHPFCIYVT